MDGGFITSGQGVVTAGTHFARFIDALWEKANGFQLPANFATYIQYASLDISSTQPLAVLALRGTMSQRDEFLITTTPMADLTRSLSSDPAYFPRFLDGGGYTTSLALMNTSGSTESGSFQVLDKDGNPLSITQAGGMSTSTFSYSIPPGGAYRFQTDGSSDAIKAGWVMLTPSAGNTPVGMGVFSYNPADILVSESGIETVIPTRHARIYVDFSNGHDTGLAIANATNAGATITLTAYQKDGFTIAGTSKGPLSLSARGYEAHFAGGFIDGLPPDFTGVLEISSETPFAALILRTLTNERDDFLMTTFPVADMETESPSPIVFPQVVDGGGYVTQFIFINPAAPSTATLSFRDEAGAPLLIGE